MEKYLQEYQAITKVMKQRKMPSCVRTKRLTGCIRNTRKGFLLIGLREKRLLKLKSSKYMMNLISTTLEAKWVIKAIIKAKASRNIDKPLVIHSDIVV